MVPLAAVQTATDGTTYVRVMDKNGIVTQKTVETGLSSDTDTEIVSGLAEGDSVVTSITQPKTTGTTSTTSVFSTFGRGGGTRIGGVGRGG